MRKVSLRNVSINDRLAVDIRIESPQPDVQYLIRIDRGTKLTSKHLNRLREAGIRTIFIVDQATADLNDYMYNDKIVESEREVVKTLAKSAQSIRKEDTFKIDADKLAGTVEELVETISNNSISLAYTSLKSHADYLAKHEFDVCKLTIQFCLTHQETVFSLYRDETTGANHTRSELLKLFGMGALLHDLGNWKIPQETLLKSSSLSDVEWEAIKRHPRLGYEMLKSLDDVPDLATMPALHHHERFSGQGYPKGRSGQDIHILGRLIALADVYTALTAERPYRVELTPNRAIEIMRTMQEQDEAFDPDLFELFMDIMPPYPIGQEVILSDGTRGVVSNLDEGFRKPIVRVLFEGDEELEESYEIVANEDGNPQVLN
jgi:HD-GYP domain-containing protein (c-di-GMP phosphodiesterase class II)